MTTMLTLPDGQKIATASRRRFVVVLLGSRPSICKRTDNYATAVTTARCFGSGAAVYDMTFPTIAIRP